MERSAIEGYLFKETNRKHSIHNLGNQGIDALLRLMKNGRLKSEMIADYTYSVLKNHRMDLLLGTEKNINDTRGSGAFLSILSCAKFL